VNFALSKSFLLAQMDHVAEFWGTSLQTTEIQRVAAAIKEDEDYRA